MRIDALYCIALLALVCLPFTNAKCSLDSEPLSIGVRHVTYVDSIGSNYLFRGGRPTLQNETFNYDGLIASIQLAANHSNITVPTGVYLIDVNLLNFKDDEDINHTFAEFSFFKQNPKLGEYIYWETYGTKDNISNPLFSSTPDGYFDYLFQNAPSWFPDQMIERVELLYKMLHTRYPGPAVIYGHCDCGCDRTGQMFGNYALKYLKYSWKQVNEWNTAVKGEPMDCPHYLAMQWYCHYLKRVEGRNDLDCVTNYKCSD